MKLYEVAAVHDPKLQALLDAIANAIPYIGYESNGTHELADDVEGAFKDFTGMTWADWKKSAEPVLRPNPRGRRE